MANKSAMLMTRIEPKLKEEAEKILEQLGIPSSVVITSLYKQIVLRKSIPFTLSLVTRPKARDEMTDEEFKNRLLESLDQAKRGEIIDADIAIKTLLEGLRQK